MLPDQLSNVGAPVSNHRLVLQLVAGLNENYDSVATFIQQSNHIPPFYEARSRLVLEETRKAKQDITASNAAGMALVSNIVISNDDSSGHSGYSNARTNTGNRNNKSNRDQYRGNQGRTSNNRGRGRGNNNRSGVQQHRQYPTQVQQAPSTQQYSWQMGPWSGVWQQPWGIPPCPYPTMQGPRQMGHRQPGILGSRPSQPYNVLNPNKLISYSSGQPHVSFWAIPQP